MRPPGSDAYSRPRIVSRIGGIYAAAERDIRQLRACPARLPFHGYPSRPCRRASMCTGSVHGYILGCGAHIQTLGWMTRYLVSSTPSHDPIWIRCLLLAPSKVARTPSDVPHAPVPINVRWRLFRRAEFWSCSVGKVGSNTNW